MADDFSFADFNMGGGESVPTFNMPDTSSLNLPGVSSLSDILGSRGMYSAPDTQFVPGSTPFASYAQNPTIQSPNWLQSLFGDSTPTVPSGGGSSPDGAPAVSNDWFSKLGGLNGILGLTGTGLGLGVKGMQLATGIQSQQQGAAQAKMQRGAERGLQGAANTAVNAATPLVNFGSQGMLGGPLSPGQEAQIEKMKREARAHYADYFARHGIADSTMMASFENQIEQDALIMRQQLAQGTYQAGSAGLAGGTGDLSRLGLIAGSGAASAAQQEKQLYQDIYSVLGRSGK